MKEKVLYIRCSDQTRRRFKEFVAKLGFKTAEDALNYLLDLADVYVLRK